MQTLNKKQIVICLIMDDLIYSKLLYSLEKIDLVPGSYYTDLSYNIVSIEGHEGKQREKYYNRYLNLKTQAIKNNITTDKKKLKRLASKIYQSIEFN